MLSEIMKNFKSVDVKRMRAPNFLETQQAIERTKLDSIQANSGWRDVGSCPICGSTERTYSLTKYQVDMVRCLACDTRYGAQVPANLDDVYKNPGYVSFSKEDTDDHFNYRRDRFGYERVEILERYCEELTDQRIIDIGCGNGYFLAAAMERSKHCYGTESSQRVRAFAQQKTGLTIFEEDLENLPENGFDIVTLFDVIEHVPEPVPFMRSIDNLLNPGGSILIFTPNFDSFSIRVMGEYSSIIDPTEHVVLFTIPSLRYLALLLGYEVVYAETQGLDIPSIISMQQYKDEEPSSFLFEWNAELQAIINTSQCADYARIMFRKPSTG